MLRSTILTNLYQKRKTVGEFNWDTLYAPSMYCFMSEYDIQRLYNIASSIQYAGDIRKKEIAIKSILEPLGFRRLASGTNRLVYSYLENKTFLIKIAIDKTGMSNTPDEFRNQAFMKPFVAKCFESHPSGIIGTFERGMPITNMEEFISIWDDVFDAILNLIGEYVIEDIGSQFFMNWMIRENFGPVLCDYPEVFKLDGNKIFCTKPAIIGQKYPLCGGEIDYDAGFNYLVCTRCGKTYRASEVSAAIKNKLVILKGETDMNMNVQLVRGNEIIVDGRSTGSDIYIKPQATPKKKNKNKELGAWINNESTEPAIVPEQEVAKEPIITDELDTTAEIFRRMQEMNMDPNDPSSMFAAIQAIATQNILEKRQSHVNAEAEEPEIEIEGVDQPEDKEMAEPYTFIEDQNIPDSEQINNRIKPILPGGSGDINDY